VLCARVEIGPPIHVRSHHAHESPRGHALLRIKRWPCRAVPSFLSCSAVRCSGIAIWAIEKRWATERTLKSSRQSYVSSSVDRSQTGCATALAAVHRPNLHPQTPKHDFERIDGMLTQGENSPSPPPGMLDVSLREPEHGRLWRSSGDAVAPGASTALRIASGSRGRTNRRKRDRPSRTRKTIGDIQKAPL
jgi:hypothetical protein